MSDVWRYSKEAVQVIATAVLAGITIAGCSAERVRISETARSAAQENRRGLLAISRGDWESAQDEFSTALKLNGSIENMDGMALNLLNMARLHRLRGDVKHAEAAIDRALALITSSSPLYSETAFEKARISQKAGDLSTAGTWAKRSLETATDRERGSRLNLLGRILHQQGAQQEAEGLARQALLANQHSKSSEEEANSKRLLGDIQVASGNAPAGMQSYERALIIDKEVGKSRKIAFDLTALGTAAAVAGMPERASGYFTRALNVCQYADDRDCAAGLMLQISRLYEHMGDKESASRWNAERERFLNGTAKQ